MGLGATTVHLGHGTVACRDRRTGKRFDGIAES